MREGQCCCANEVCSCLRTRLCRYVHTWLPALNELTDERVYSGTCVSICKYVCACVCVCDLSIYLWIASFFTLSSRVQEGHYIDKCLVIVVINFVKNFLKYLKFNIQILFSPH